MKNEHQTSVLIVGCGWLGTQLGHYLSNKGHTVWGTTRSKERFPEIEKQGIIPVQWELSEDQEKFPDFQLFDSILISITPGRGEERSTYKHKLKQLGAMIKEHTAQVIMFSSTSAYNGLNEVVKEEDAVPDEQSENEILAGEAYLLSEVPTANVFRLAGLIGPNRHPIKYLAGRTGISNGEAPVNLIHSDDILRMIEKGISNGITQEIVNVCSPHHPTKSVYYSEVAQKLNLELPEFKKGGSKEKCVDGSKVTQLLSIEYKIVDLLDLELNFLT